MMNSLNIGLNASGPAFASAARKFDHPGIVTQGTRAGPSLPRNPFRSAQAAVSLSRKDSEDALHLYLPFEERFPTEQLKLHVKKLEAEDSYVELNGV